MSSQRMSWQTSACCSGFVADGGARNRLADTACGLQISLCMSLGSGMTAMGSWGVGRHHDTGYSCYVHLTCNLTCSTDNALHALAC